MSYKYYIYGLNVESELELDEAYEKEFNTEPDVRIVNGVMPEEVQKIFEAKEKDEICVASSANEIVYRIPRAGEYWVTKDKITVNYYEGKQYSLFKCFIFGSAFGYNMILRGKLLLHGGAIAKDGKGVIVTGDSGTGKSTISDCLLSNGYKFIADDTCAISIDADNPHIYLGYPQQKLCRDAAIKKGYDLSELIYIDEDRDKFAKRLEDDFLPEGADFYYLFELKHSETDKLNMFEITGTEKLMMIIRNIYRGESGFDLWGVPPEYMKLCASVAAKIRTFQIERPDDLDTLQDIRNYIDSIVKEK